MPAYYNEIDPKAAAWLRELIKRNLIAPGEVDERSIEDIRPAELAGFTQCHFFAGIGVWSYALRQSGWQDSRPVWTGSCPCQPFSVAGEGKGFDDERHLWPAWFHLISQCRPAIIFGEQVASKIGNAWLDLVWSDLESLGYAFAPTVLPVAGFGGPHGRHRIFFVADSAISRSGTFDGELQRSGRLGRTEEDAAISELADTERDGGRSDEQERQAEGRAIDGRVGSAREARTLDDAASARQQPEREGPEEETRDEARLRGSESRRATNGFWRDAEWIYCRDGKYRATEPGVAPLVARAPARVVRLRGYGNAINAAVAEEFIKAYMSTL